jgi:hypothetical protein
VGQSDRIVTVAGAAIAADPLASVPPSNTALTTSQTSLRPRELGCLVPREYGAANARLVDMIPSWRRFIVRRVYGCLIGLANLRETRVRCQWVASSRSPDTGPNGTGHEIFKNP